MARINQQRSKGRSLCIKLLLLLLLLFLSLPSSVLLELYSPQPAVLTLSTPAETHIISRTQRACMGIVVKRILSDGRGRLCTAALSLNLYVHKIVCTYEYVLYPRIKAIPSVGWWSPSSSQPCTTLLSTLKDSLATLHDSQRKFALHWVFAKHIVLLVRKPPTRPLHRRYPDIIVW